MNGPFPKARNVLWADFVVLSVWGVRSRGGKTNSPCGGL